MRREDINQLLNDVSPDENWTHITNEIDSSYDNKNKNPQRFWEFNKDFRKSFTARQYLTIWKLCARLMGT